MSDCRNEGDLAASTASLGGIIGIAEKIDTPAVIENCENKGHISSRRWPTTTSTISAASPGKVNGAFTLRNCVNRGNLTAAVERDIAVSPYREATTPSSRTAKTTATSLSHPTTSPTKATGGVRASQAS